MKILRTSVLLLLSAVLGAPAFAKTPARKVTEGNRLYRDGDLEQALQRYTEAQQEIEDSSPVDYNIGNVLYRQGDYERALEEYRRALAADDPELARWARFNMGNAHFQAQAYDKAVEDFSEVLRLSPDDMDAKRNLEISLRALQQQPPQQQPQEGDSEENDEQEQQQDGQQQEGEEQSEQEQQQAQDGEEQEGEQQQQQQDQEQPGEQEQQPQQPDGQGEPEPSDQPGNLDQANLSAQEAQRILDALREEEKENMKKAFRAPRRGRGTGKDW